MRKLLLENVQFQNEKLIKNNYNSLELSVDYKKPDYNYAYGTFEGGGIYISFQPMNVTGYTKTYLLLDDMAYKIKVQELTRKNQKKVDKVFEQVEKHKNLILDLFVQDRRNDIFNLVKSFAV